MITDFHNLIKAYNNYAKLKYRRKYWRDLKPEEIASYSALRETVIRWACQEKIIPTSQKENLENLLKEKYSKPLQQKPLRIFHKKDIDEIVTLLINGDLIVIPNGKIYVIFGADDEQSSSETTKKINIEKLRHHSMPIVKLSSIYAVPSDYVQNNDIRVFLSSLVSHFQPIGLLLPNRKPENKNLFVFYGGEFFEELIRKINHVSRTKTFVYVSSANITTTGANTTDEGVLKDFGTSKYIVGIVDEGDLKKQSQGNNSSTIIECLENGRLTYYRLGYPPKDQIDVFADKYDIKINNLSTTRQTIVR